MAGSRFRAIIEIGSLLNLRNGISSETGRRVTYGDNNTLVSFHRLVLWWGLSHQCDPTSGERYFGQPVPKSVRIATRRGLSSSMVNVLWGMFNLVVAYVLVARVGRFDLRQTRHVIVLGLGMLVMALMLARAFGRFHGGNSDDEQ